MKDSDKKLIPITFLPIFKAIMLDESLKDTLIDIIHLITGLPEYILEDLKVIDGGNKSCKDDKTKDIIVKIFNMRINISMNKDNFVLQKNQQCFEALKTKRYESGTNYIEAPPVIQINFDNYYFMTDYEFDIYKVAIVEVNSKKILDENNIEYHICLPNIYKRCHNLDVNKLTRLERYSLILKTESYLEATRLAKNDNNMKKLVNKLAKLSNDKNIIKLYNSENEDKKLEKDKMAIFYNKGLKDGVKQLIIALNRTMSLDELASKTNISFEELKNIINKK